MDEPGDGGRGVASSGPSRATPRWVKGFAILILALAVVAAIVVATGLGGDHGPGRHAPAPAASPAGSPAPAPSGHGPPPGGHGGTGTSPVAGGRRSGSPGGVTGMVWAREVCASGGCLAGAAGGAG